MELARLMFSVVGVGGGICVVDLLVNVITRIGVPKVTLVALCFGGESTYYREDDFGVVFLVVL